MQFVRHLAQARHHFCVEPGALFLPGHRLMLNVFHLLGAAGAQHALFRGAQENGQLGDVVIHAVSGAAVVPMQLRQPAALVHAGEHGAQLLVQLVGTFCGQRLAVWGVGGGEEAVLDSLKERRMR